MNSQSAKNPFLRNLVTFLMASAALLFELATPLGVAAGVLYAPLVLLSIGHQLLRASFAYALVATLFIIAGYLILPPSGVEPPIVLINRGLSILAVWITALVIYRQKLVQQKLRAVEEVEREIVDSTPIGIALVDKKGNFLRVNPALCEIVGYDEKQLLNIDLDTITYPEDRDVGIRSREQIKNSEINSYEVEKRYVHRDGNLLWVRIIVGALRDAGSKKRFVLQVLDITHSKDFDSKLNSATEFQNLIFETIPDLLFVKDSDLRIVQANQAFLDVYPKDKQDKVIGYTTLEEYNEQEVELFTANDRAALETGYHEVEEEIQFPNGRKVTILTKKVRFYDGGNPYILAISRDVTYLKEILNELTTANEELEMFSYIASHDLKAPLRGIDNLSQWIYEDIEDSIGEDTKKQFQLLQSRVKRLEAMLDDILEYSRIGRITEEPVDVDTQQLANTSFAAVADTEHFRLVIPVELPILHSPLTPLEQIFSNLIGNAIKHHDRERGTLTITWQDLDEFTEFNFTDDGPGIAEKFHEKAFSMFQTLQSRDVTEGTGLGLSIVKKLTELQGGIIKLGSNAEGRGTRITLTWPKTFKSSED